MKPKFDRVTAAVKGFLIRRLLNTEKIQNLIQTIRDTVELLLKLYEEVPPDPNREGFEVKPEEQELNRRLLQQVNLARSKWPTELHWVSDVFRAQTGKI